jgi:hypothetical protein
MLSEMIIVKINKRMVWVICALTYFVLIFSVIIKLLCVPYISAKFQTLGIAEYFHVFGLIELLGIVVFINQRTIGIGLILLCSYFGGAIATDIHFINYLYQPVIVLALVLITALIRKPSIFFDGLKVLIEN